MYRDCSRRNTRSSTATTLRSSDVGDTPAPPIVSNAFGYTTTHQCRGKKVPNDFLD